MYKIDALRAELKEMHTQHWVLILGNFLYTLVFMLVCIRKKRKKSRGKLKEMEMAQADAVVTHAMPSV